MVENTLDYAEVAERNVTICCSPARRSDRLILLPTKANPQELRPTANRSANIPTEDKRLESIAMLWYKDSWAFEIPAVYLTFLSGAHQSYWTSSQTS